MLAVQDSNLCLGFLHGTLTVCCHRPLGQLPKKTPEVSLGLFCYSYLIVNGNKKQPEKLSVDFDTADYRLAFSCELYSRFV